jgi:hypothetical protein
MASKTCRMAVDRWRMADDRCEVKPGGNGKGKSGESMSQECWDLLYGASTPRPQAPTIAGTSGGCGEGERERSEPAPQKCRAAQKAPNEAKLESTQSALPLTVKSSAPEPAGRERSRSAVDGRVPDDGCNVPCDPITPAGEGKHRAWGHKSGSFFPKSEGREKSEECSAASEERVASSEWRGIRTHEPPA